MQDTIPDSFNEDNYGIIIVNEIQYELRSLITFNCNTKWDGTVYARHGGYHIEMPIFFSKHMNFKFTMQKSETQIFLFMLELTILQAIERAK